MDKTVIGVCGKPCSGKSTFIQLLCPRSVEVIDCDKLAKEILKNYSHEVNVLMGTTDPKAIADIIFNDKDKYKKYTSLIWGVLGDVIKTRIEESTSENVILDAPLLMEADLIKQCDIAVRFVARPSRRVEWAKRRGWDATELARRDQMFIGGSDTYPFIEG